MGSIQVEVKGNSKFQKSHPQIYVDLHPALQQEAPCPVKRPKQEPFKQHGKESEVQEFFLKAPLISLQNIPSFI